MRVAVIGGGITGLSAAYYFRGAGLAVTLIEKAASPGGLLETTHRDGCVLERGPDSFLASKPWAVDLAKALGLGGELIPSNDAARRTFVVRGGRLIQLPDGLLMMIPTRPLSLAASPLLSWKAKARMGFEFFRRPKQRGGQDRSVEQFLLEHFDREILDYLAEPLLAGVYGGDPAMLSAASVLPRFIEFEEQYGSLTRGALAARRQASRSPLFLTLKNGLGSLISALENALRSSVNMRRGNVEAVLPSEAGFAVRVDGEALNFDRVIVACPAPSAAKILEGVGEVSRLLASIPYNSAMTIALGYRRAECPVAGFGFLVPKRERQSLLACTFVHNKFQHRAPGNIAVLRCFLGGDSLNLSDDEAAGAARRDLARLLHLEAQPLFTNIARHHDAMPQFTVGHAARIARIDALLENTPGLYLAGNAYRGIGIPDCVRSGKEAAERIISARTPESRGA
jgi:oxygen-dependent protoporphyrinogen oxidase